MIADDLKSRIETYARHLDRENRLLELARSGDATPDLVASYLSGILFMIRQTPVHLELAARRAREIGRDDAASFFEHKEVEERDHDRWALDDFATLKRLFGTASAQPPPGTIVALAHFVESSIEAHPLSYLAYILLAEHMTVLVGPTWLEALESRCGIPRSALSVVAKHVELDREHVEEGLREVDALLTEPDRPALLAMLEGAMSRYDAFYDAIYERHTGPGTVARASG